MNKKKSAAGRPKIADKVKVVSAYLKDSERKRVVKKYGSVTDAIRMEVLPKCG